VFFENQGCLDTYNKPITREDKREFVNLLQCKRGLKRNDLPVFSAIDTLKIALKLHGDQLVLGWSGGKCSTIVLHMALKLKPDIKVIFTNTGVEFPENVKYVRKVTNLWNVNLTELKPDTSFWKIVEEYGFPQIQSKSYRQKRQSWNKNQDKKPMCCFLLKELKRFAFYKEHNITGDIGGLRACESRTRAIHIGRMGMIYYVKRGMVTYHPIALWNKRKCEKYLEDNKIPFNETYITQNRNGCWACTAYIGWKNNLLKYSPKMYEFLRKKMRKKQGPLDTLLKVKKL